MCGIAGLASCGDLPPDAPLRAEAMGDVLAHRGPDASGIHSDPHVALAHRRLSIVDLSAGGQPLANEDGSIWVSYNGEIYNHADVRRVLEARGHRYRTRSDTETIVHAYEEWGDDCVQRFRGMFAFAVWDSKSRRLLLARDRLGVKPLYWARQGDLLLFASEIKALLSSGFIDPVANDGALPELLGTRYLSGTETLFRGIRKLMPGHLLVFEKGDVSIRRYWDIRERNTSGAGHFERPADTVARFRDLLETSIRLRLMSDVPLGMFLSGGIDSSAIAALMARQLDRPLKTFSVAFEEHAFNELEYADQVAHTIGAEPNHIVIDAHDFFDALPRLVWHEDEPIAHPSSVPLYFVSALARRQVTVVLTGEGSDELLAGYGRYPRIVWNWWAGTVYERLIPAPVRHAVARTLVPAIPGRAGRYVRRSFLAMDRTPELMMSDCFAAVPLRDQQRLLAPERRAHAVPLEAYAQSAALFATLNGHSTLLDRLLYADMKAYLVELLMKQDQMSMAASIESRVPFLDHELVEFAASLPDNWKLSGLTTKRILREAMKGVLPDSILRRPKMGFPVPFGAWMRGSWNGVARDLLLDRRARERGVFDPDGVDRLLADHACGRRDETDRIWALMNVELWYRTFIDRDGIQTLPAPR